jgi:TolA-binding protein
LVNQGSNPAFDDKIQNLQNQINSLQQKIIQLEHNQTLQIKKALSELLERSQAVKIGEQDNTEYKLLFARK